MSTNELDLSLHRSVLKREAVREKEFAEAKAKRDEAFLAQVGTSEMTAESLLKLVDSDRRMYYRTLELNDKLYIHYKGWRKLQNLEKWTGLRAMYAECNAFSKIEGLQACRSLRSLFLQENCIQKIEGLENCPDLWSLNLSNNFIERIEGLSHLKNLNTLMLAKNKLGLGGVDDLSHLVDTTVCSLDVQGNRIEDPDVVPEVFMRMGDLRVLYLKDNPCTKKIINYRKGITANCKDLRYLDDRPVFEEDRRAAEAFNRGGLDEERAERRRIREEKDQQHLRNMQAFQNMIDRAKAEKREKDGMRAEDKYTEETDPVESEERRMKRLKQKWAEENADDLKDDAKEYALRCLKAEKEKEQAEGEEASRTETLTANAHSKDGGIAEQNNATADDDKKVDNRKLVYEDVWDDVVPGIASAPTVRAAAQPSGGTTASAKEILRAAPAEEAPTSTPSTTLESSSQIASSSRPASSTSSWYERYSDKASKIQASLEAGATVRAEGQAETAKEPRAPLIEEVAAVGSVAQVDLPPSSKGFAFQPPPRAATSNSSAIEPSSKRVVVKALDASEGESVPATSSDVVDESACAEEDRDRPAASTEERPPPCDGPQQLRAAIDEVKAVLAHGQELDEMD